MSDEIYRIIILTYIKTFTFNAVTIYGKNRLIFNEIFSISKT